MKSKQQLGGKGILLVILNILILLIFILLPWFSINIGVSYSQSAALTPWTILRLMFTGTSSAASGFGIDLLSEIVNETQGLIYLAFFYTATWYLIVIFIGISFYQLLFNKSINRFIRYSKYGYIIDLVTTGIFALIRFIVISQITSAFSDYSEGYEDFLGFTIGGILNFGIAFYLILLCSVIGLVTSYFIVDVPEPVRPNKKRSSRPQVPKESKDFSSIGEEVINKPIREILEPDIDLNDSSALVILRNEHNLIEIERFPFTIGKSKTEADFSLYNNSVDDTHLFIDLYDDMIIVSDLGSVYGTFINNELLDPNEYFQLLEGDILRIGDLNFQVLINETLLSDYEEVQEVEPEPPVPIVAEEPVVIEEPVKKEPSVEEVIEEIEHRPARESIFTKKAFSTQEAEAFDFLGLQSEEIDLFELPEEAPQPDQEISDLESEKEVDDLDIIKEALLTLEEIKEPKEEIEDKNEDLLIDIIEKIDEEKETIKEEIEPKEEQKESPDVAESNEFSATLIQNLNEPTDVHLISKVPIVIGSSRLLSDIVIDKDGVSKEHLRLDFKDGAYTVIDLGSISGTFVNGRKVSTETESILKAGDILQIGIENYLFQILSF